MKFSKIIFKNWRQFEEVEVEFHPRLTIITGANGAGKSTILKVLSQHFGWPSQHLSTPRVSAESGVISYFSGIFDRLLKPSTVPPSNIIGSLGYMNGVLSNLVVPESSGVENALQIASQQTVQGLHISSHRPVQIYQKVVNIPINSINADQAYQLYFQEMMNKYQGGYTVQSPMYRMKETIISIATFGAGNQFVQKNPELEKLFTDFKTVLSKVLPPSVGFLDISIRIPDVVIVTETGEFVIDASSGGLMSLIDLAWQIFLFSHGKEEFVVTLDEPENHLHPSMQRSILRRLIEAFPQAQFIVATHSPFIVSSVKDSSVYVLQYKNSSLEKSTRISRRISSIKLDTINTASTASEILRDVLGVPVTLPEWAEEDLKTIVQQFDAQNIDGDLLNDLRHSLDAAGLGEYYPEALRIMTTQQ